MKVYALYDGDGISHIALTKNELDIICGSYNKMETDRFMYPTWEVKELDIINLDKGELINIIQNLLINKPEIGDCIEWDNSSVGNYPLDESFDE